MRACTHVSVLSVHLGWCVPVLTPGKKEKEKRDACHRQFPLRPAPLSSFPPSPPFQQTGFWCYANLPSGHSLSAGTHPVLLTCPCVLPFFLVLFPYTSWPSLLLSHTPCFSLSLSLSLSPASTCFQSCWSLMTWPFTTSRLFTWERVCVCVSVCVCVCVYTCARTSTCAFYSLCLHCVCCKARKGGLLIC